MYDIAPERRPLIRLPDGLELRASADPADPLLDLFFDGYDQAFVLPDEKEKIQGFRDCLALNIPPLYDHLAANYGPFREFVAVAEDPAAGTKALIGGANFICFPLQHQGGHVLLSMHLNYVFVLPEFRRRGYLGQILRACDRLARNTFRPQGHTPDLKAIPLLTFMELNDPLRLNGAQYALDTGHSGLDQFQRIGIWRRMGVRVVDFPYIQPPLSETQGADHTLLLAVLGANESAMSACVLREHLVRFFAISVLKGEPLRASAEALSQLRLLDKMCEERALVALLDPGSCLCGPEGQMRARPLDQAGAGLRDILRRHLREGP